jgi:hypothetical protein
MRKGEGEKGRGGESCNKQITIHKLQTICKLQSQTKSKIGKSEIWQHTPAALLPPLFIEGNTTEGGGGL